MRSEEQPGAVSAPADMRRTDWAVDMARLAKSIEQIGDTYDFKAKPKAEDIFTSEFLPPAAERKL